jgi:iron complex transport system substrate-binding protein
LDIIDAAGRPVSLAAPPRHVLATGNPSAAAVYCVAPDSLIGWPEPIPGQMAPIHDTLPASARLNNHEVAPSARAVRDAAPDLVLDYGTCDGAFLAFADSLQAETGVPVAVIDGRLEKSGEALALLGRVLGAEDRTRALFKVWDRIWAGVGETLARADRPGPRVHYAIGPTGDKTVRRGSIHLEALTILGATNVADVEAGAGGRVPVDARDIAAWDPDLVLTIDPVFHATAHDLPGWRDLRAVRDGRVYLAPAPVLSWFDYPPSVNRIIGLAWLAKLFYGDAYPGDLNAEVQAFHQAFYGVDLGSGDITAMLTKAGLA